MNLRRCYMCSMPGDTDEHVPPRALFPESKDFGGANYRRNLISVPSCHLHNAGKSHDDEFLMVALAGIVGNNSIAYRHRYTKVDRALRRSSHRLLQKVFVYGHEANRVKLKGNRFIDVIWGTPDVERLETCFERVAYGLYYHHFNEPLDGQLKVVMGFLVYMDRSAKNFMGFIAKKIEIELDGKPRYGDNPDVFFYQLSDPDQFGVFTMRMCFYSSVHVYAAFQPKGSKEPYHLAIDLMNRGIKTVFRLGDESFEVN